MAIAKFEVGLSANEIPTWSLPFGDATAVSISSGSEVLIPVPEGASHARIVPSNGAILVGLTAITGNEPSPAPTIRDYAIPEEIMAMRVGTNRVTQFYIFSSVDNDITIKWLDAGQNANT
jgi:hypothetical protein